MFIHFCTMQFPIHGVACLSVCCGVTPSAWAPTSSALQLLINSQTKNYCAANTAWLVCPLRNWWIKFKMILKKRPESATNSKKPHISSWAYVFQTLALLVMHNWSWKTLLLRCTIRILRMAPHGLPKSSVTLISPLSCVALTSSPCKLNLHFNTLLIANKIFIFSVFICVVVFFMLAASVYDYNMTKKKRKHKLAIIFIKVC